MTVRQRISGIWLISMTLLALFAYTVYFVAQMWLSVLQALYLTLAVMQIAALILYLWGPEKLSRLLETRSRTYTANLMMMAIRLRITFFALPWEV